MPPQRSETAFVAITRRPVFATGLFLGNVADAAEAEMDQ